MGGVHIRTFKTTVYLNWPHFQRIHIYHLLDFFILFSLRFSFNVFSGFLLADFFASLPLDINFSFSFAEKILGI